MAKKDLEKLKAIKKSYEDHKWVLERLEKDELETKRTRPNFEDLAKRVKKSIADIKLMHQTPHNLNEINNLTKDLEYLENRENYFDTRLRAISSKKAISRKYLDENKDEYDKAEADIYMLESPKDNSEKKLKETIESIKPNEKFKKEENITVEDVPDLKTMDPFEIGQHFATVLPGNENARERKDKISRHIDEIAKKRNIKPGSTKFYSLQHDAIDGERSVIKSPENIRKAIDLSLNPKLKKPSVIDPKTGKVTSPAEFNTDLSRYKESISPENQMRFFGYKRKLDAPENSEKPEDYQLVESPNENIYKLGPEATIPKWKRDFEREIFAEARKQFSPLKPYPTYPGERIPQQSRFEKYAKGYAENNLLDAEEEKEKIYRETIDTVRDAGRGEVAPTLDPSIKRSLESPSSRIHEYMNPYIENVIESLEKTALKNFRENVVPAINSEALMKGHYYTGTRQKALEKAAVDLQEKLTSQIAALKHSGYSESMGRLNENQERELRSAAARATAQENDLERKIKSSKGVTDIDKADVERKKFIYNTASSIGAEERERERERLSQEYQDWVNRYNYPDRNLQRKQEILEKLPSRTAAIPEPEPYRPSSNLYGPIGGLLQGAAFAQMGQPAQGARHAHGGSVRAHFAEGGEIGSSYEEDVNKYIHHLNQSKRSPWIDFMAQAGMNTAALAGTPGAKTLESLIQGHASAFPAYRAAQEHNSKIKSKELDLLSVIEKSRVNKIEKQREEGWRERKHALEERKVASAEQSHKQAQDHRNLMAELAVMREQRETKKPIMSEEEKLGLKTKQSKDILDYKENKDLVRESEKRSEGIHETLAKLDELKNLYNETSVLAKGNISKIPLVGSAARALSGYAQPFNTIANKMAGEQAKLYGGTTVSNFELQNALKNMPNLEMNEEALKRSSSIQEALLKRTDQRESFERNAILNGVPKIDRMRAWEQFRLENPIFDRSGDPIKTNVSPNDYLKSNQTPEDVVDESVEISIPLKDNSNKQSKIDRIMSLQAGE